VAAPRRCGQLAQATSCGDTRTLSGLAAEISHLRTAFEAVAGNVRQHEERLRRLERTTRKPIPETRRNDLED